MDSPLDLGTRPDKLIANTSKHIMPLGSQFLLPLWIKRETKKEIFKSQGIFPQLKLNDFKNSFF